MTAKRVDAMSRWLEVRDNIIDAAMADRALAEGDFVDFEEWWAENYKE